MIFVSNNHDGQDTVVTWRSWRQVVVTDTYTSHDLASTQVIEERGLEATLDSIWTPEACNSLKT